MSNADNPPGADSTRDDATVIGPQAEQPAGNDDRRFFSTITQPASSQPAAAKQATAQPPPAEQESQLTEGTATPSLPRRRPAAGELPNQFGRYRIQRPLGKGAMGAVYLALDTQLDREVALKVPYFDQDGGADLIKRFYREARSMATLHHPNLCAVYDVGEIDGVHFLTMAYIAGRSLADLIRHQPGQSDGQIATLIMKLALALDSAHQAGIMHRDLKPANIMIRPGGEPVIMDFGLASRQKEGEAHLTHSGIILGTPAYMSPEQVEGHADQIGAATDVYALGVILYQLLSGKLPFEGSVRSVLMGIVHRPPPPLHEVCAQVNTELEMICQKAMAKSIDQRYCSARELAGDLKRFLRAHMTRTAAIRKTPVKPAELDEEIEQQADSDTKLADRDRGPAEDSLTGKAMDQAPEKLRRLKSLEVTVQPASRLAKRNAGRSKTKARSARSWQSDPRVWIAGAGGVLVVLFVVTVLSRSHREKENPGEVLAGRPQSAKASQSTNAGIDDQPPTDPFTPRHDAPDQSWRLSPEPRRFPSLYDTISHSPPWLIADKEPPFDLVRYFEVPVWEDNAAPVYLKAFFEFGSEVYTCFPESSREQQRQISLDRQQRFFQLDDKWKADHQSVPDEQFNGMLQEFETGFALLRQAQRKRDCVFEIAAGLDLQLPHIQTSRYVARVEVHRARRDLREGRVDGALSDVAMVLRMAHDVNNRGCAITFVSAFGTDNIVCDEVLRPILLHQQFTKEHCTRLIAMLREHARQKDNLFRQCLQGQYVILRVTLHDFQYHVGSYSVELFRKFTADPATYQPPRTAGEAMASVLSMMASTNTTHGVTVEDTIDKVRMAQRIDDMTDADYDREVTFANAGFKSLVAISDRAVWERLRMFSKIQDQSSRNQESRIVRYLCLADGLVQVDRRNRTQLAGLICLACLRLWQFDHVEPPPSLESLLAAAGVDDMIPDPYGAGQPLQWAMIDRKPVIYSLGGNEYDDGGKKEWDLKPEGSGDMTFRLETIEELRQRRAAQ